jgi:ATP-dependent exoDNAse (exonuclease V) beta subunit
MKREIVEAGAGCGKTYGLVTRYLAALGIQRDKQNSKAAEYRKLPPSKILTLTFTNDAAEEMRSRILLALTEAQRTDLAAQVEEQGRISTFHAFCYKVLKPHLPNLGYADADVLSVIESNAHKLSHVLKVLATSKNSVEVQRLIDLGRLYKFCSDNWRRPSREIASEIEEIYRMVSTNTEAWIQKTLSLSKEAMAADSKMFADPEQWPYQVFEFLSDQNWSELKTLNFAKKGRKNHWKSEFPDLYLNANLARDYARAELHEYLDPDFCQKELQAFNTLFNFLDEVQSSAPKLLDFDALEFEAMQYLTQNPDAAPKFDLIIVDEFQDTNRKQVEIIERLMHPQTEVYYVGDPKQSIYLFRGGDVRVFESEKKRLELSSLDINRRSLPAVLSFMNELTRDLFTDADDPEPQVLQPCDEKVERATTISSKICLTTINRKESTTYWDTMARDLRQLNTESTKAILCQQWSRAFEAFRELKRRGLPVEIGNELNLSSHHLSDLWIAYLKALSPASADDCIHYWNQLAKLWQLDELNPEDLIGLPQDPRAWLRMFVNAVSPKRWPDGFLWLSTIEGWLQDHSSQFRWVPSAVELASAFEKSMNMRLSIDSPSSQLSMVQDKNKILITTIHQSKGLQYQDVFLIDLFAGTLRGSREQVSDASEDESLDALNLVGADGKVLRPLYFKFKRKVADQKELAEKKRLFYVAYTRAEENLYFYLDPAPKSTDSKPKLESEIWQWPQNKGVSWQEVVRKAAARVGAELPIEEREIELELDTYDEDELRTAEPQDMWTLPAERSTDLKVASKFMRAGTRTYIDEVLFATDTKQSPPKDLGKNFHPVDPLGAMALGSALHKILEKWDGSTQALDEILGTANPIQKEPLHSALKALSEFPDLQELWSDAAHHPERLQREMGLFVFGDDYRLSGFADLIWFRDADTAIVIDWKTSSTEWSATAEQKIAKTEAQVALYASALKPLIKNIEIWSLAIIFKPKIELRWLFKKTY